MKYEICDFDVKREKEAISKTIFSTRKKFVHIVWVEDDYKIPQQKILISIKDWQKELSIIIEFHQCSQNLLFKYPFCQRVQSVLSTNMVSSKFCYWTLFIYLPFMFYFETR